MLHKGGGPNGGVVPGGVGGAVGTADDAAAMAATAGGAAAGAARFACAPANGQRLGGATAAPPPCSSAQCGPPAPSGEELVARREKVRASVEAVGASGTEEGEALLQRNAAFEAFRRSYRKNEVIEENKQLLKAKYDEAKALGERVNAARAEINTVKSQIETVRRERAVAEVASAEGGGGGGGGGAAAGAEEERLKAQLEDGKRSYKEGFAKLKELKGEIEHLQHLLEQSRRRLQQDFESWHSKQQDATPQPTGTGDASAASPSPPRAAAVPPGAPPAPMLTGQPDVDQEILAFYQVQREIDRVPPFDRSACSLSLCSLRIAGA